MCAIEAGRRGRRVLVLERAERIGKKILISGGGRCNFTNLHTSPGNFLSANPHFAKSALARYTPPDFTALVEKHRIPYHEKKLGQLFCDRSAHDITGMLDQECRDSGVEIKTSATVRDVSKTDAFAVRPIRRLSTRLAWWWRPEAIDPENRSDSFGYDLARQFGMKIQEPRPALVRWFLPMRIASDGATLRASRRKSSLPCEQQTDFSRDMLFTHRGLSGPAILQVSSYWNGRETICLDLAPERNLVSELLARGREPANWRSLLRDFFTAAPGGSLGRSSSSNRDFRLRLGQRGTGASELENSACRHGGFGKAEVTAGGVDTDELSAKTMESRKVQACS